jgi:hypothetical protein
MMTPDMFFATVAPQADPLFTIGAGAIAAMVSFVVLGVAAVLGTAREMRRHDAVVAPSGAVAAAVASPARRLAA